MNFQSIDPDKSISLLVNSILIFEEPSKNQKTVLPFFADGYPGLMYQETENGLLVNPHNKLMPSLFLYGQTIKPIELVIEGSYRLIVFQLYPFVLKSFFGLAAKTLNDDCYDLQQLSSAKDIIKTLGQKQTIVRKTKMIGNFLSDIFQSKKHMLDFKIRQAIELILNSKGQMLIQDLSKKLHINKRTFERRFSNEAGISPKQFSQMIQFQQSLTQLTLKDYNKLTDIVYNNGYADQSHFIKVFKAYTGKTPHKFYPAGS